MQTTRYNLLRIHLLYWDAPLFSDILDGQAALGDDADTLSDSLGCDWMITSDHDNLNKT